jgi:uncharacterized membrane protein
MKLLAKSAVFLSLIAILLSFAKFDHCRTSGWGTPDQYVHACYSDLSALFSERAMSTHSWPYSSDSNAVEYPPLTGVVMYATSFLVSNNSDKYLRYFDVNAILLSILFIAVVILLKRMRPDLWYLLPLCPAVVASLFINWDLWAVLPALAAIYYFDKVNYKKSGVLLGIGIATKFFPVVLLLPAILIFWRRGEIKAGIKYGFISFVTWLLINLPFIITTPVGWARFFKLNSTRNADWGSIWHALSIFGIKLSHINFISTLVFIIGAMAFTLFVLGIKEIPSLASISFFIVAIFVTASKVYSPQYILWLTPLAILAMKDLKDRNSFWIWQGAEMIYHLAIWQYLAKYTGANFGIPEKAYALAALIRIIALAFFALGLMRKSTLKLDPQGREFLLSAQEIYP